MKFLAMTVRTMAMTAVLAGACAHKPPAGETAAVSSTGYQPLTIGNEWVYAGTMMGAPVQRTVKVVAEEDGYFVYDDEGRSRLRHDHEGLRDEKRYLLQQPVEKGRTWTSIVSATSTERYEIVDVGFACESPAGAFRNCVKVQALNRIDRERQFRIQWVYAPGVGQISMAFAVLEDGREIPQGNIELQSFKLEGQASAAAP